MNTVVVPAAKNAPAAIKPIRIGVGQTLKSSKVVNLEFTTHADFLNWLATTYAASSTKMVQAGDSKPIKDGQYLCAPMKDGARSAANVEAAWHTCVDLDEVIPAADESRMHAALTQMGCLCAAWQTVSSVPEAPRWRITYCLDRPVERDDYALVNWALETRLRQELQCTAGHVDATAGRPEQPQLLRPQGHDIFIHANGAPVKVTSLLAEAAGAVPTCHESADVSSPPPAGSGRHPLLRRLEEQGLLGSELARGMWALRCPWQAEHTAPSAADGGDTVLFEPYHGGYRGWGFKCHHAHCAERKFRPHLMEALGLLPASGAVWDSDLMNARRFVLEYGSELRYAPEQGWVVWDAMRWAAGRDDAAMQYAKEFAERVTEDPMLQFRYVVGETDRWAKRTQSSAGLTAMLSLTRSEPGIPVHITDFDASPMLLNCRNGTVDLKTGELRPHCREDLISRLCPVEFDPQASCPLWDGFLWQVLGGDQELYQYVQRAVGYCLTGRTDEQVFFFCHGPGANGKSVFLETLIDLMGDYATTARTEILTCRSGNGIPNDVAALRGSRFVAVNETADNQRFNEPTIKDLVGGDAISARFLYREFFSYRPNFKIWLRGNHKPAIYGTDHGIWRRVHLVPFTVTIPPEERDLKLMEKLRAELAGILAWAVQGCLQWQQHGLQPPPSVLEAVQEYKMEMDVIGNFLEEKVEQCPGAVIKAGDLYAMFKRWAEEGGEWVMNQRRFGTAIRERGFSKFRNEKGVHYRGLRLRMGA